MRPRARVRCKIPPQLIRSAFVYYSPIGEQEKHRLLMNFQNLRCNPEDIEDFADFSRSSEGVASTQRLSSGRISYQPP
jgi:hypothetical protein